MTRTLTREVIKTKQERIAKLSSYEPKMVLRTLAHHIDVGWMGEAYRLALSDLGLPATVVPRK